jgi:Na+-driven multidrug efflux pump
VAAVGAMSLAFPLIFLLLSVGGGFTVAGSTLVARRDDRRGVRLTTVKPARPIDGSEGP